MIDSAEEMCSVCGTPKYTHIKPCAEKVEGEFDVPKSKEIAENFEGGLAIATREILEKLKDKEKIVVSVAGKTGGGKSHFSRNITERLLYEGVKVKFISTDDYYVDDNLSKGHDLARIKSVVLKEQHENRVVVLEGLVLGQEAKEELVADYKVYVSSPAGERMARKILRDSVPVETWEGDKKVLKPVRTVQEFLKLAVDTAESNPEAMFEFERTPEIPNLDLVVKNDFKKPGDPQLFIQGGELQFEVGGAVVEKNPISEKAAANLQRIGIRAK